MTKHAIVVFCTIIILSCCISSCGPDETPFPASQTVRAGQPPNAAMNPLDWLANKPFQPSPDSAPNILLSPMPEGFRILGTEMGSFLLPNERRALRITVEYEKPIEGKVFLENRARIEFYSYGKVEDRDSHLNLLTEKGYQWSFEELAGQQIARYTNGIDGCAWISGSHMILI